MTRAQAVASPRRLSRTSGISSRTNGSIRPKPISTQKDTANQDAAEHGVSGAAIKKIAHLKGEEEPHEPGLDAGEAGEQIHARTKPSQRAAARCSRIAIAGPAIIAENRKTNGN